jgi:hypothetical protein
VDPRFLPSAQVYETCTVTKDVAVKTKLNRKHVLPGMKLQYSVVIKRAQDKNKGKGRHLLQQNRPATLEGLGVRITLPKGVVYIKTKSFPPISTKGEGGRRRKKHWTYPESVEIVEGGGTTLTWNNVSFAHNQRRQMFKVSVQVVEAPFLFSLNNDSTDLMVAHKNIDNRVLLIFGSDVFQLGGIDGAKAICAQPAPPSVAEVKVRQSWGG